MQFGIHQDRPSPNFAKAIKQNLALPTDGVLLLRILRVKRLGARLWYTVLDQDCAGQLLEIVGPLHRHRLRALADKEDLRAQRP